MPTNRNEAAASPQQQNAIEGVLNAAVRPAGKDSKATVELIAEAAMAENMEKAAAHTMATAATEAIETAKVVSKQKGKVAALQAGASQADANQAAAAGQEFVRDESIKPNKAKAADLTEKITTAGKQPAEAEALVFGALAANRRGRSSPRRSCRPRARRCTRSSAAPA